MARHRRRDPSATGDSPRGRGLRASTAQGGESPRLRHRSLVWLATALAVTATVLALIHFTHVQSPGALPASTATYVGGKECVQCHAREHAAWQGSQHDRAMQPATEQTVLGNFANATFTYAGMTSTFFKRDGKFFVNTEGADGKLADFEISHTFGVDPLQQYLIEFPDGRKQALGIAWDSRPKAAGGQRWFHLYPEQRIKAGDRLHWTAIDQNWNHQCADCHSTALRKNFDEQTNRFRTTWTDINVNCEACHGPGSSHVAWARRIGDWKQLEPTKGLTAILDERHGVTWQPAPATGNATRSRPRESTREIEVCARCHSRRYQFTDANVAGQPFTDGFRPALLDSGLYHVDGQMRDEVYNHGSFLQSKMNARGVTCSDCHDPHSQKLRTPGNGVCAQCHAPAKFDSFAHHHHANGSKGAECAACHMPTTTYMVIDSRHDHSIRIPRPDLSEKLGTPNACNNCHHNKKPAWATQALAQWFPERKPGFQNFAEAFAGADRGEPAALAQVAAIANDRAQPAIVRASAIARLSRHPGPTTLATLRGALDDPDALIRVTVVAGLDSADRNTRATLLARMVDDPSRMVRIEAARVLADTSVDNARLALANAEFIAEQRFNADRPEAHLARGNFAVARGDIDGALAAYCKALAIDPGFAEAAVNLADLHRIRGDEKLAEKTLRDALARDPTSAVAHHALGLVLVRQKQMAAAIAELARAATLAPKNARFAYVYAVALFDSGRKIDALRTLDTALVHIPNDRELLFAAASYRVETGDTATALRFARRLQALDPENPQLRQFVQALQSR